MAMPSTLIQRSEPSEEELTRQSLQQLSKEAAEHTSALTSLLQLAGELEKSGLLTMGTALVAAKDDILAVAMEQVNKPGSTNAIQNLMKVAQTLGRVDGEHVNRLLNAVVKGLE